MARGRKTGGRVKGTPNKRTLEIEEKLAALGCDPIEGMARIAMDENNPPELRGKMFAELAGYVAPKRKAVEHTGPAVASEVTVRWMTEEVRSLPTAELINRALQAITAGEIPSDQVPALMDAVRHQLAITARRH